MNRKLSIIIAVFVGAIIITAVLFSVLSPGSDAPVISLPSPSSDDGGSDTGLVSLNSETVQTAIATLSRCEAYSREYSVTNYSHGGSAKSIIKVWQDGERIKIALNQDSSVKNILFRDNTTYIWYDDDPGAVFTSNTGSYDLQSLDHSARLIHYEELLGADSEQIIDAGYVEKCGENCIFAEYLSEDLNYVNRIYVSVNTGLLVAAEVYKGEVLTYLMETVSTNLATPEDEIFAPPVT
ncbi:MAG: hypothetical protein EOM14_07730 [Clostridia bacterium]|nr:hypothetical protein [Clostridia bacterium]